MSKKIRQYCYFGEGSITYTYKEMQYLYPNNTESLMNTIYSDYQEFITKLGYDNGDSNENNNYPVLKKNSNTSWYDNIDEVNIFIFSNQVRDNLEEKTQEIKKEIEDKREEIRSNIKIYNEIKEKILLGVYVKKDANREIYTRIADGEDHKMNVKYYQRFVEDKSDGNYPNTISKATLLSGSIFESVTPIIKLGIQTIPGVRFSINANNSWVIIGATGIYELDLTQSSATIMQLRFEENSLKMIDAHDNGYLIIDVLSEQEE